MDALEVFGREGDWQTIHYADKVKSLEVWECNPEYEENLRKNLPNATVKITDSYEEIKRTPNKFGLVVIDNPLLATGHIDHFDLFPHVFRVLKDRAFLVVSMFYDLKSYPLYEKLDEEKKRVILDARTRFYGQKWMSTYFAYRNWALQNGFMPGWSSSSNRNQAVAYFAMELVRS